MREVYGGASTLIWSNIATEFDSAGCAYDTGTCEMVSYLETGEYREKSIVFQVHAIKCNNE